MNAALISSAVTSLFRTVVSSVTEHPEPGYAGRGLQLAVHGRNDLADSLGSAGGVRNGVDCGGTVVASLREARAVEDHLGAGVGVDGGHEASLDAQSRPAA